LPTLDLPGRIRVISNAAAAGNYISGTLDPEHGLAATCTSANDALVVQSTPAQGHGGLRAFRVVRAAPMEHQWIGLMMTDAARKNPLPARFVHPLRISHTRSAPRTSSVHTGVVKSMVWDSCCDDGDLKAVWEEPEGAFLLTGAVNLTNKRIMLVNDFDSFCATNTHSKYGRARLVFEPL